MGVTRFVYVDKEFLGDKFMLAQILHTIVAPLPKGALVEVFFFDNFSMTPTGYPMTDRQLHHWKARYNRNPKNSLERFAWVKVVGADRSSPPQLCETEAVIRPGYAE